MIYLLKSGEYIKIGYTQSLRSFPQRMESYFVHNPNIEIKGFIEGSSQEEHEFHKNLEKFKISTGAEEWFKVPDDIYINLLKIFNPENKTFVIIGFDKKPKALVKRKELTECFSEVHSYTVNYFTQNMQKFYLSNELKALVEDINKKFGLHLNVRPASIGLLVGIKKTSIRIPIKEGGGTKSVYKYTGDIPSYEYS